MEEIFSDIKSGRWWFSTVAVAIAVSIISNIIWELLIKKYIEDKHKNKGYEYDLDKRLENAISIYKTKDKCLFSFIGALTGGSISLIVIIQNYIFIKFIDISLYLSAIMSYYISVFIYMLIANTISAFSLGDEFGANIPIKKF